MEGDAPLLVHALRHAALKRVGDQRAKLCIGFVSHVTLFTAKCALLVAELALLASERGLLAT